MQKTLKVARREYLETTKTKTFIFSILMLPLVIVAIVFFARRLDSRKAPDRPPMKVAVTDMSGQLSDKMKSAFEEHNAQHPKRQVRLHEIQPSPGSDAAEKEGKAKLRRRELDAYVVLDNDILEGKGKLHLYSHNRQAGDVDPFWPVRNPLYAAIFNQRCELRKLNLSQDELKGLRNVPTEEVKVGSADNEERVQKKTDMIVRMMVPFFFMYLLFLGIFTMGQQMLSSIIEEKNSRVIEVLLSAITPFELMAGKILGLVGVGLTVVALWGSAAYGAARWQGINFQVGSEILPYFFVYYVLGFFLFSSVMVGIGSVCNTIKETQSLMMPVMLCCIVPLLAWQEIIRNPGGTLARVLSFLPPTTPMVMILRLSSGADVSIVEVLGSIVLLAASVLGGVWVAARIFRTGILMYGKRPGLREVGRWLKQA
ncbi:MAG: ABC transporter permease [Planctomycetota bacterium]|jgi:ABC-2 type transport system permease protein